MGISDRVKSMMTNTQEGAKSGALFAFTFMLRLATGFFIGYTLGLIGQELTGYGNFSLIFLTVVVTGIFMKISSPWRLAVLLVFDLICILVAQLLRMYILLAP